MTIFLCVACGTSFPEGAVPPPGCPICEDERQFVPPCGQRWTTRAAVAAGHRNAWRELAPGLLSVHPGPKLGIGQRALLLRTPAGNVLWDCVALLDGATEAIVRALGGLRAIAISHPHYYTVMQDWAAAFGAPIHLHADDRQWVMRPDPAIAHWEGERLDLLPGVTLVRLGGHFAGGTVLHCADGAGVLLTGDIVQVAPGLDRVSFLWSYPNMMPLPGAAVARIGARLRDWRFGRLYGAFEGQDVVEDAEGVVQRSARRYVALVEGR